MSYPYPDLEPGSFESIYAPGKHTCRICDGPVKPGSDDGCCDTCNGFPPVEREKQLPVYEPAAVVVHAKPYTFWFDARYGHTRGAAIQHARKYARLMRQPVEVL